MAARSAIAEAEVPPAPRTEVVVNGLRQSPKPRADRMLTGTQRDRLPSLVKDCFDSDAPFIEKPLSPMRGQGQSATDAAWHDEDRWRERSDPAPLPCAENRSFGGPGQIERQLSRTESSRSLLAFNESQSVRTIRAKDLCLNCQHRYRPVGWRGNVDIWTRPRGSAMLLQPGLPFLTMGLERAWIRRVARWSRQLSRGKRNHCIPECVERHGRGPVRI